MPILLYINVYKGSSLAFLNVFFAIFTRKNKGKNYGYRIQKKL